MDLLDEKINDLFQVGGGGVSWLSYESLQSTKKKNLVLSEVPQLL